MDVMTRKAMAAYKHGIDMRGEIRQFQELRMHNQWIQQRLDRTGMNYDVLKKVVHTAQAGKNTCGVF